MTFEPPVRDDDGGWEQHYIAGGGEHLISVACSEVDAHDNGLLGYRVRIALRRKSCFQRDPSMGDVAEAIGQCLLRFYGKNASYATGLNADRAAADRAAADDADRAADDDPPRSPASAAAGPSSAAAGPSSANAAKATGLNARRRRRIPVAEPPPEMGPPPDSDEDDGDDARRRRRTPVAELPPQTAPPPDSDEDDDDDDARRRHRYRVPEPPDSLEDDGYFSPDGRPLPRGPPTSFGPDRNENKVSTWAAWGARRSVAFPQFVSARPPVPVLPGTVPTPPPAVRPPPRPLPVQPKATERSEVRGSPSQVPNSPTPRPPLPPNPSFRVRQRSRRSVSHEKDIHTRPKKKPKGN